MPHCLACGYTKVEPWATAHDEEYFTTPEPFTYYRCKHCSALSIDPIPVHSLKTIYPKNYYSFDETINTSLIFKIKDWLDQQFFKRFISRLPHSAINILDIGGGSGAQLNSLKKVDARINRTAIVDMDQQAAGKARQHGHDYFCGRFEDYAPAYTFEVILMLNFIEHVDNPKALLMKARSLLSPNGLLIIKTPNTDSLDARLFRHKNWGGYHCPRHWVLFNQENFAAMAKGTGLKINELTYTQGAPFWTTSLLFSLYRNKLIHLSAERPAPKHPLYPLLNIFFAMIDLVRGKFAKTSQMLIILGADS